MLKWSIEVLVDISLEPFIYSYLLTNDESLYVQVFDLYGVGLRQSYPTPNLLKELNLKVNPIFGNNLDFLFLTSHGLTVRKIIRKTMCYSKTTRSYSNSAKLYMLCSVLLFPPHLSLML